MSLRNPQITDVFLSTGVLPPRGPPLWSPLGRRLHRSSVMRPSQPAARVWSRGRRPSIGPQPPPIIADTYLLPKTVDFGRPTRRVLPEIPQSAPDSRAPDLVDAPVRSSEGGVISLQRRSSRWFSACSYGSCPNAVFHGWESHRPTAPSSRSTTGRLKGSGGAPPPTARILPYGGRNRTAHAVSSADPLCAMRNAPGAGFAPSAPTAMARSALYLLGAGRSSRRRAESASLLQLIARLSAAKPTPAAAMAYVLCRGLYFRHTANLGFERWLLLRRVDYTTRPASRRPYGGAILLVHVVCCMVDSNPAAAPSLKFGD